MKDLLIVLVVLGALVLGVIGGMELTIQSQKKYCAAWSRETGRETKFIVDRYWYKDCLVKTSEGWISGTNLIVDEED